MILILPLQERKAVVEPRQNYEELKEIFGKCGEDMEWKEIGRGDART